jgi:4-hydroxybenzoate polyprenyltransferase
MKRGILFFLDVIFVSRPVLLLPVWGFCAFGYVCAAGGPSALLWQMEKWNGFWPMFVFSLSVGAVYSLNQLADRKVDGKNKGFALLAHGNIRESTAWISALSMAVTSAIGAFLILPEYMCFSLAALIIGILYSFKPFSLSGRPVADFLANAAGYGIIAFGAGWSAYGRTVAEPVFFLKAAPYFLLMCAGSICSTLPDYEGDRLHGKKTTAVVMGPGKAHLLAVGFIAAACIISCFSGDWIALASGLLALPVNILYVFVKKEALMEATYKATGAAAMLLASVVYPAIVAPSLVTFAATWLYFRLRHHVSYPTLVPVNYKEKG